ncbi:cob(I)yrinic acid a,c-diamide adenosyltransferase [Halospeciosus flavus]|uniref:cob(I)yrinic acid a,c-diamide adenosyltransferase n=1 Tax=Halospeciosus flavus TaxID=3032283 RepID=UPI0036117EC2
MKIYTGRGDTGETDLRDMSRVSKANPRIEAYGTVDEVNTLVGVVRPTGYDDLDDYLERVQNHLHIVQADFANPDPDEDDPVIREAHVDEIEDHRHRRRGTRTAPVVRPPRGSEPGAKLHHARAVCRRAERRAVALQGEEDINDTAVTYLNRLSDALFQLARLVNEREGVPEENPTY